MSHPDEQASRTEEFHADDHMDWIDAQFFDAQEGYDYLSDEEDDTDE